jgi:hypothetical protein
MSLTVSPAATATLQHSMLMAGRTHLSLYQAAAMGHFAHGATDAATSIAIDTATLESDMTRALSNFADSIANTPYEFKMCVDFLAPAAAKTINDSITSRPIGSSGLCTRRHSFEVDTACAMATHTAMFLIRYQEHSWGCPAVNTRFREANRDNRPVFPAYQEPLYSDSDDDEDM